MEVETAALANYTCSVWESSHTFSVIHTLHTLKYFSWDNAHIPSLCLCCTTWRLSVAVFILCMIMVAKMCSVELPGAYLYDILTKWHIIGRRWSHTKRSIQFQLRSHLTCYLWILHMLDARVIWWHGWMWGMWRMMCMGLTKAPEEDKLWYCKQCTNLYSILLFTVQYKIICIVVLYCIGV